jgi:acetone carboxylase gamma subunit
MKISCNFSLVEPSDEERANWLLATTVYVAGIEELLEESIAMLQIIYDEWECGRCSLDEYKERVADILVRTKGSA